MDFVDMIVQVGLPVVLGLLVIVAIIAGMDRHSRKKTRCDGRESPERDRGNTDPS